MDRSQVDIRMTLLRILAVFFPLTEILKQILMTVHYGTYQWWYFPFQLCAMPLYILPAFVLCRDPEKKKVLASFLADFAFMGGTMVFLDQSGMQYELGILTVHSYLWHFCMILTALLLFTGEYYDGSPGMYRHEAKVLAGAVIIAEIINTVFRKHVINMFFISPFVKMNTVVIRDIAKYTGDGISILIYILAEFAGGFIIHFLAGTLLKKVRNRE